ncbi:MAG: hypothetical protein OEU92_29540, partial [Alphaproteobacteria bacterium]|nr:hypothetical protein [Alphaproteobacteria bacterium]
MSDVIETGSRRNLPDAGKSRAEAIGKKRKIDRSEDELEFGLFVGDDERKPGPDKGRSGHRRKTNAAAPGKGEVVGPKRHNVDSDEVKSDRRKSGGELRIAAPLAVDDEQPTPRRRAQRRSRPLTDSPNDWRRLGALAALSVLLVILTGATFLLMPRYD